MSALDWIEFDNELKHRHLIPEMKGSFNVTIGDAVNGIYGARHTHIYGGEIKLVCDPEDLLAGKIAHAVPLVSELAFGIGGNATFVYAQNTSATYGGPKIDIRRAQSISKQSDNVIGRVGGVAAPANSPVDKATCKAVATLSILVVAVPAVTELLMRFKYADAKGEIPNILKLCTVGLTSRLMDFLKKLEECSTWADLGDFYAHFGANALALLRAIFVVPCLYLRDRYVAWRAEVQARAAAEAAEAAAAAQRAAQEAAQEAAGGE